MQNEQAAFVWQSRVGMSKELLLLLLLIEK